MLSQAPDIFLNSSRSLQPNLVLSINQSIIMAELVLDDSLLATVKGRVAVVVGMQNPVRLEFTVYLHKLRN